MTQSRTPPGQRGRTIATICKETRELGGGSMPRSIIVILSEHGYWGEELLGPLTEFDAAGYSVPFATPTGKRPRALPPSLDSSYVDPPLGRSVTTDEVARLARQLDESNRLDNPLELAPWVSHGPSLRRAH